MEILGEQAPKNMELIVKAALAIPALVWSVSKALSLCLQESYSEAAPPKQAQVVGLEDIPKVVVSMRASFEAGNTLPIAKRVEQLRALKRMLLENERILLEALRKDLHRPDFESSANDIGLPVSEINGAIRSIKKWSKPRKVGFSLLTFPSSQQMHSEPRGLALIISTWNFPVMLALTPLVGSIASGCATILQVNSMSQNTAELLVDLAAKYLDPEVVTFLGPRIGDGDRAVTAALLEHAFDTIFFTGSPNGGRYIAAKAAVHLTPCTLELGGKNPAIIDKSANLSVSAKRVLWARMMNAGQFCLAPDYVVCHEDVIESFLQECKRCLLQFYGEDPKKSDSFGRLVNIARFEAVKSMLDSHGGHVIAGGASDASSLYIAPTVVRVDENSPAMEDETFGPILWVTSVPNCDIAIRLINTKPRPLALYLFCKDRKLERKVIQETSSGGITINGCIFHAGHPGLPFGGVGNSGMGTYHGKASFDCFSHEKAVLKKSIWPDRGLISDPYTLYPPYTEFGRTVVRALFGG